MKKAINKLRQRFIDYRAEVERSRELDAQMERALVDPGLIDRILEGERPTVFNPGPRTVEQPVTRPLRSIDGIIRRAAAA